MASSTTVIPHFFASPLEPPPRCAPACQLKEAHAFVYRRGLTFVVIGQCSGGVQGLDQAARSKKAIKSFQVPLLVAPQRRSDRLGMLAPVVQSRSIMRRILISTLLSAGVAAASVAPPATAAEVALVCSLVSEEALVGREGPPKEIQEQFIVKFDDVRNKIT